MYGTEYHAPFCVQFFLIKSSMVKLQSLTKIWILSSLGATPNTRYSGTTNIDKNITEAGWMSAYSDVNYDSEIVS